MKYFTPSPIALIFCLASCSSQDSTNHTSEHTKAAIYSNNPFFEKYAGGYMIEVRGASSNRDAEGYALRKDGTAKWMWIVNDGSGGADVQSEKLVLGQPRMVG